MQNTIAQFLPIVLMFVVMYFLIIRPQTKKAKAHQAMLSALKKGDRVLTNGGLFGHVRALSDKELTLEIAPGIEVCVARSMVTGVADVASGNGQESAEAKKEVGASKAGSNKNGRTKAVGSARSGK